MDVILNAYKCVHKFQLMLSVLCAVQVRAWCSRMRPRCPATRANVEGVVCSASEGVVLEDEPSLPCDAC